MPSVPLLPRPAVPSGLEHPGIAERQDGVFTRLQARGDGFSDGRQRRLIRSGLWVPVAGRAYRNASVPIGPWQRARAVALNGLVVSHDTAGQLWSLATGDDLHGIGRVKREVGITTHQLDLPADGCVQAAGMCLTAPMRTLVDLLSWWPPSGSVPFVTDALRRGLLTPGDLAAASRAARGRWGASRVRVVAASCAGNPHSFLEWRAHSLLHSVGGGWEFNVPIHDGEGLIGLADALHRPSRTIVELDGRAFHGDDRFQRDRTRDQRFAAIGYLVIRFTFGDVEHRPRDFVERTRRAVHLRTPRRPG